MEEVLVGWLEVLWCNNNILIYIIIKKNISGPFQEKAFSQPVGKFSEPFKTQFG